MARGQVSEPGPFDYPSEGFGLFWVSGANNRLQGLPPARISPPPSGSFNCSSCHTERLRLECLPGATKVVEAHDFTLTPTLSLKGEGELKDPAPTLTLPLEGEGTIERPCVSAGAFRCVWGVHPARSGASFPGRRAPGCGNRVRQENPEKRGPPGTGCLVRGYNWPRNNIEVDRHAK